MKKKSLLAAAVLAALMVPQVAGAEGFGIVQWSAEGVAMGGARMFAENDVSMVAANPASMTKFQGKGIGMNATYISPHGQSEAINKITNVNEHSENRVHPGIVPGTYYVQQMTDKDWIGIGAYTRYGMVSGFQPGSLGATNNLFAKMNGLSITPVYAHKFDKKWSAAVGAEINYVGLEMNQDYTALGKSATGALSQVAAIKNQLEPFKDVPGYKEKYQAVVATEKQLQPAAAMNGVKTHLKGDSYALGWNAAVNYTFDEKNDLGIVYRSKVKHSLEADFTSYAAGHYGSAYGEVTLPDQWSIGYNHKFDNKNRVELNATRTNWHNYDSLDIYLSPAFAGHGVVYNPKHYKDTWRYAIGYEHKFSDKFTGMLGFSFDDHAIPYDGGDFIVPTGLRRTYSIGLQYNYKRHTIAAAMAWEQIGDLSFHGLNATDGYDKVHTHDNFAKIFSIGYSYKF